MAYRVIIQGVPIECDTAEEARTLAGWKEKPRVDYSRGPTSSEEPKSPLWEQALRERKKTGHTLQPNGKQRRGFAVMDPKLVSEIARKGGRAAHVMGTAHEFTVDEARAAGRKGGQTASQNRTHMAAMGRAGGHARAARRQLDLPMERKPSGGALDGAVRQGGGTGAHEDPSPERGAEESDDGQTGG